jgi:hypothetical protein
MLFSWEMITVAPWETALFVTCVFLAGIVRGAIGFGFSALVIASTSLFMNPSMVVPLLILLEIAASVHMMFSIWNDTLWKTTLYLSIGTLVTTPIGVYVLSVAPEDALRLIIALVIFVMTLLYMRGVAYKGTLNSRTLTFVGCISGLFNGMAAVGGLFIAIFLASAKLPIRSVRATVVAFFLVAEIIFLISASAADVYNARIFNTFFLACIPMFIGIIVGTRLFNRLDEKKLRRLVLVVLIVLSVIGLIRSGYGFMFT